MNRISDQSRAILAAALSLVVIVAWSFIYKPPKPQPNEANQNNSSQEVTPNGAALNAPGAAPATASSSPSVSASRVGAVTTPPVAASAEKTIIVENDLYRVELSSRGAVVRSWQLVKYTDDHQPPRVLDVVNADVSRQSGNWPFALQMNDAQLETAANQALYVVTPTNANGATDAMTTDPKTGQMSLAAPAELEFHWSDGHLDVSKRLKFDRSYIVEIETSVRKDGQPIAHRIAWLGGFGDTTAYRAAVQTTLVTDTAGKISVVATKNIGAPNPRSMFAEVPGSFQSVGIEDLYFAAAFLPPTPPPGQTVPADVTLVGRQLTHSVQTDNKTTQEILPEMAAGSTVMGPLAMRVFVGPKDIDMLKAIRPPLNGLVQLGFTGIIAEPLFYILRWLHHYIPNYGWAIVVMTVAINILLYPLKMSSWRSMQRMQKVAPEIKTIQDRFKKYSARDPRKQEMNKEVMAVYSREGINPLGSCLPTVAQMPIWWALYRMLTVTIELRHAPWVGWIHDLSGRDPYYILPILMALVMYGVQKMTPMAATDPSQQRMMALTPVLFGGMFIVFPVSSGLVLYILTSNVIAMLQQWHLNRTSPLKPPPKGRKK